MSAAETTKTLTRREVFEKVKTHLLTQNAKAAEGDPYSNDFKCKYRAPGGAKCAVGCLIPDELYTTELEGKATSHYLVLGVLEKANVIAREVNVHTTDSPAYWAARHMLSDLQDVHDYYEPKSWPAKLDELEAKHFDADGAQ